MTAENGCGYGSSPRCSKLQADWQREHVIFRHVVAGATIKTLLSSNPLAMELCPDPSVLLPPITPSVFQKKPRLRDYVQLPLHLWIPDFFFPDLVPHVPCPTGSMETKDNCDGRTSRRRWHSGGPRLIHGVHSAVYLHCWEYTCTKCKETFNGWQNASVKKLPQTVQEQFRFMLSKEEGVTEELEGRIVDARLSGSSLSALRKELQRNRYNRMYAAMGAYYRHCEEYYLTQRGSAQGWLLSALTPVMDKGAPPHVDDFPPILNHPTAYFDHPAPSTMLMSEVLQRHARSNSLLWNTYMQQLTADRICVDATFKVAKGLTPSASRLLYSMMDMDSGCILHQQMLTHERREDVLPMLSGYAARCREQGARLPIRVCSDRGLKEAGLFLHPDAFPDAHINIDPWHFQQNFEKTLHRSSDDKIRRSVAKQFNAALYQNVQGPDGKTVHIHAEPQHIISTVEALIAHYSNRGSKPYAVVTDATRKWWKAQKQGIQVKRMCSNPTPWTEGEAVPPRMSSSPLENHHRQLNRVLRMARVSESTLHALLLHFDFRWNVTQRRAVGKERDWGTFDLFAVHTAYTACVRAVGRDVATAATLWGGVFTLPVPLNIRETFGFLHTNHTLESQMVAADEPFVFSHLQLDSIVTHHLRRFPLISSAKVDALLNTALADLGTVTRSTDSSPQYVTPTSGAASAAPSSPSLHPPPAYEEETPPRPLLPPQRKMTTGETLLLSTIMVKNKEMGDAVKKEDWTTAAGLWNSLARHLLADSTFSREIRTPLHSVHADMIRGAVVWLNKQAELKAEEDIIQLQVDYPTIQWKVVSPAEKSFTEYEDAVLCRLVEKWSAMKRKKRVVDWKEVERVWHVTYSTEIRAGQRNGLYPRTRDMIKSHWFHMEKMKAKTTNSAPTPRHQSLPSSSTSPSQGALHTTSSPSSASPVTVPPSPGIVVSQSEQPSFPPPPPDALVVTVTTELAAFPLSSDSSGPELSSSSNAPSPLTAPPQSRLPSVMSTSSSCRASSADVSPRRSIASYFSGFWQQPQASTTSSPPPPSSLPSPLTPTPAPPAAHRPPTSVSSSRWPTEQTALFNELWDARGYEGKWKYEDFRRVWPVALHGECEPSRFWNKLGIETRKRQTGSSVIPTKGKKSGRKLTPTKKAADAGLSVSRGSKRQKR